MLATLSSPRPCSAEAKRKGRVLTSRLTGVCSSQPLHTLRAPPGGSPGSWAAGDGPTFRPPAFVPTAAPGGGRAKLCVTILQVTVLRLRGGKLTPASHPGPARAPRHSDSPPVIPGSVSRVPLLPEAPCTGCPHPGGGSEGGGGGLPVPPSTFSLASHPCTPSWLIQSFRLARGQATHSPAPPSGSAKGPELSDTRY